MSAETTWRNCNNARRSRSNALYFGSTINIYYDLIFRSKSIYVIMFSVTLSLHLRTHAISDPARYHVLRRFIVKSFNSFSFILVMSIVPWKSKIMRIILFTHLWKMYSLLVWIATNFAKEQSDDLEINEKRKWKWAFIDMKFVHYM